MLFILLPNVCHPSPSLFQQLSPCLFSPALYTYFQNIYVIFTIYVPEKHSLGLNENLMKISEAKKTKTLHMETFLTSKIFFVISTCSLFSISRSFSSSKRSPYTLWVSCSQHLSNSIGAFMVSPEQKSRP